MGSAFALVISGTVKPSYEVLFIVFACGMTIAVVPVFAAWLIPLVPLSSSRTRRYRKLALLAAALIVIIALSVLKSN
jgi:hypothetical protein